MWAGLSELLLLTAFTVAVALPTWSSAAEPSKIEIAFSEDDLDELRQGPSFDPGGSYKQVGQTRTYQCGWYEDVPFRCRKLTPTAKNPIRRAVGIPPYPAPPPLLGELGFFPAGKVYRPNSGLPAGDYSWAKVGEVISGDRVVDVWYQMARTGELLCTRSACARFMIAWSDLGARGIEGLASCSVQKIGKRYSPPIECRYIYISIDEGADRGRYMVALTRYRDPVIAYSGRMDFLVTLPSDADQSKFIKSLATRLENRPYSAFTQVNRLRLDAAADFKYFDPLGLYTIFTVSVYHFGVSEGQSIRFNSLAVATSLNVSAQNAPDDQSYRLPPRAINNKFLETLRATILDELQNLCPNLDRKHETTTDASLGVLDLNLTRCH